MATWYLRWILSTHSRSTLEIKGFEPSIDLDFENGFFEKGYQLNNFFFGTCLPSSGCSRGIVKIEEFELAATSVATSDFQNFFGGALRAPQDPSGMEKWLRNPWETPSPSAKQIDSIFAMDYGQKCLRGVLKCNQSGRRTGPCKNGVIRACGHRRGTLGRPSDDLEASKNFFYEAFEITRFF